MLCVWKRNYIYNCLADVWQTLEISMGCVGLHHALKREGFDVREVPWEDQSEYSSHAPRVQREQ